METNEDDFELPEGMGEDYFDEVQDIVDPPDEPESPLEGYDASGRGQYQFYVETPSGATQPVLTEEEVEYYEDRAERYLSDHKFTSVTDLQDLDRVLSSELLLYRYDVWLALGNDYFGMAVSEKDILGYTKEISKTLITLKKSMGLDKITRDKDQGADFVNWLDNVRKRAKEFGIMRNEQADRARTLMHEIMGQVQTYRNADDIEREELGLNPEQVLDWLWDDVFPRFNEIDEFFRNNPDDGQKYWISTL